MAIAGNLRDISLTALIQMIIQEGGVSCIEVHQEKQIGRIYLEQGQLSQATLSSITQPKKNTHTGEEVVYEMLNWKDGRFTVEKDIIPQKRSIQQSWDLLLMEGLRQLDEKGYLNQEAPTEDLSTMLHTLTEEDAAQIKELLKQQEVNDLMASKSEQIQTLLTQVVNDSSDLLGAVIVSTDGLMMASSLSDGIDGNRVAAVSAGLISLAGRSAQQLKQGEVRQTLVQADEGNIIAIRAGTSASFVALTPVSANLGMVFLECQDAAQEISKVL